MFKNSNLSLNMNCHIFGIVITTLENTSVQITHSLLTLMTTHRHLQYYSYTFSVM